MACVMERVLSVYGHILRRFSPITKEMTPIHRDSLLNEALSYYQGKKIDGLRKYIPFDSEQITLFHSIHVSLIEGSNLGK